MRGQSNCSFPVCKVTITNRRTNCFIPVSNANTKIYQTGHLAVLITWEELTYVILRLLPEGPIT